jgi:hypothetical protein
MGWGLDWTRLPLASPRSARHEGAESLRCSGTLALCFCSRASSISAWEAMRDGPRKRALAILRQPFVPIKTKRVWSNETGAGVSLLTGMCAAIAAFMLSLPNRSRLWLLLPTPALFTWLSTLGYQCLTDWISLDPNEIRLGETARCFATLVLTGLPLSLTMLVMLQYAGPLHPPPLH